MEPYFEVWHGWRTLRLVRWAGPDDTAQVGLERRLDDAVFGDDGGDEAVGRDVEGGVGGAHAVGGERVSGEARHFLRVSLLYRDLVTAGQVQVYRRGRDGDVEGDGVGAGEDGQR